VHVVEAYRPAKAIGDQASMLLDKLTQHPLQLPSPQ
jgi:hypothetical protein